MRDPVLAASSAALAPAMPARRIVSRRFFLQLLDLAKRPEIARVTISTNGLRIAGDFDFCRELARRNVSVSLQLDALRNPELSVLRGTGRHAAAKARALANLERAGVRPTIVAGG